MISIFPMLVYSGEAVVLKYYAAGLSTTAQDFWVITNGYIDIRSRDFRNYHYPLEGEHSRTLNRTTDYYFGCRARF
jgi:hypothetical protein